MIAPHASWCKRVLLSSPPLLHSFREVRKQRFYTHVRAVPPLPSSPISLECAGVVALDPTPAFGSLSST